MLIMAAESNLTRRHVTLRDEDAKLRPEEPPLAVHLPKEAELRQEGERLEAKADNAIELELTKRFIGHLRCSDEAHLDAITAVRDHGVCTVL